MQRKDYFKITDRDIAKWIVSRIPLDFTDEDLGLQIETYHQEINRLSDEARQALKCAMVFANKVPQQEREDLFQDLALTLWRKRLPDVKLAYAIARCDWIDWWKRYKVRSHYGFVSVEETEVSEAEDVKLQSEILVGEVDFEQKMCNRAEARWILSRIPRSIKALAQKRLLGQSLNVTERRELTGFIKANPLLVVSRSDNRKR
jgi:DNA-directed RNA polymerase specialized sigma24 family protein